MPTPRPILGASPPTALLLLLMGFMAAPASSAAPPDSVATAGAADDLAATSDPPWNPPAPVPAAQGWETALRAPGTIASLPFRALGLATRAGLHVVDAHDVVPRVTLIIARSSRLGLSVVPGSLGDRTGFGAGVGLRPRMLRVLKGSVNASTNGYNRERVVLDVRGSGVAYESGWRPREPYFGLGPDSRKSDASAYAASEQRLVLTLAAPWWNRPVARPPRVLLDDPVSSARLPSRVRPELSAWVGETHEKLIDGRDPGRPSAAARFPTLAPDMGGGGVNHWIAGARVGVDARLGHPHWSRGGRLALEVERHGDPSDLSGQLFPAGRPAPSFTRTLLDGEAGCSFFRDPHTLRLAFRLEDRQARGDSLLRLTDLARLGGSRGLAGFEPGRFADRDLALGRLTYLFPIARYLELDTHVESGAVFARPRDARLAGLRQSYGVALRLRNMTAPLGAIGVDWSAESVRFAFALGGVE